jgi:UDP-glucose 4-epimerase
MKVAITGISSYFASVLFPLLEKDEEITEILGLDIVEPKFTSPKLTYQLRDVRDPKMEDDLKGYDALIHLAFIVVGGRKNKKTYSINIDGSKNVFKCAVRAGIKKIIHSSSAAGYGSFPDNPTPITEEQPFRIMKPKFYYNETKILVEQILDEIEKANPNIVITRFRPHVVIGYTFENPLPSVFTKGKITVLNRKDLFQIVWVEDVAQAFLLALKKDAHGAFNLGADNPITFEEVAKALNCEIRTISHKILVPLNAFAHKLRLIKPDPGWLRSAIYPIIMDNSKAKKELGWKPKYDNIGAIKAFMEYLEERGEI